MAKDIFNNSDSKLGNCQNQDRSPGRRKVPRTLRPCVTVPFSSGCLQSSPSCPPVHPNQWNGAHTVLVFNLKPETCNVKFEN